VSLGYQASPSVVIVCFSPERLNLGFLIEGKSCCYIHHTFLLGFPTAGYLLHQPGSIKLFSGAVAREKSGRPLQGEFFVRTSFTLLLFCFTLFILPASFYIKNPKKKLESLVVIFTYLLLILLKWPILKTPSCVTLLA
jgi:hypothetical protein